MSERRRLLGELSVFQVIAGALAAMTSAWIASALGVAGTIIGAAVGSLVVTFSSAFYTRTLDRTTTLVVRTDRGTAIQERLDDDTPETTVTTSSPVTEERPRLHWRTIALTSVVVLVLAFGAMGAYELITDKSYGSDPDNARIGNPFSSTSTDTGGDTDDPEDSGDTDPTPTPAPTTTTPAPTATATTPTPTPTPTSSPTTPE